MAKDLAKKEVLTEIANNWWKTTAPILDEIKTCKGSSLGRTLYEALRGQVPEVYAIGDCVKARNIREAVHEGAYIARQIRLD